MKDWKTLFQYGIAALIILGFIILVFVMVFRLAPEGNNTLLNIMVGTFGSMTVGVVNYLYGSTKSSSEKNEMLFKSTAPKE
jgi:uncharacterized BrkB/YihY/UPF0761 family membrane protein